MSRGETRRLYLYLAVSWTLLLLLIAIGPDVPSLAAQPSIGQPYCTNVRDGSMTISWNTDTDADGQVEWGTTTALGNTTADTVTSGSTHYVTLTGLSPNTEYVLQVRSGSSVRDNNGAYYRCTTGPTLSSSPGNKIVFGYVRDSSANIIPNAIVYLRLVDANGSGSSGSSQWVSARADSNGLWSFNLLNIRTAHDTGYNAYFGFTDGADKLEYVIDAGTQGTVGDIIAGTQVVTIVPGSYPHQQDWTIDGPPNSKPLAIGLREFGGVSASVVPLMLVAFIALATATFLLIARRRQALP